MYLLTFTLSGRKMEVEYETEMDAHVTAYLLDTLFPTTHYEYEIEKLKY